MTWEPHKIWIGQCESARGIKDEFGSQKALGYLVGEKLMNHVRAADDHPEFAEELPKFITEIHKIFPLPLLQNYLETVQRLGALGHVLSKDDHDFMRAAGAIESENNPRIVARDAITFNRIKVLLLKAG